MWEAMAISQMGKFPPATFISHIAEAKDKRTARAKGVPFLKGLSSKPEYSLTNSLLTF